MLTPTHLAHLSPLDTPIVSTVLTHHLHVLLFVQPVGVEESRRVLIGLGVNSGQQGFAGGEWSVGGVHVGTS